MPGTPPATTPVTSPKRLLHFGHPRAGRRGNNSQQSIPVIHEKWRRSREMLAPGMGDLERCKRQDKKSKSRLLRIRQVILCLQLISSYVPRLTPRPLWACPTLCLLVLRRLKLPIRLLVVALLAQSLVIFQATEGSFLNGATRVWPEGIEVFSTVMVLSFHAVLMVFAIVLLIRSFTKTEAEKVRLYTIFIASGSSTLMLLSCIVFLKAQASFSLSLYPEACLLSQQTGDFDYNIICESHNLAFGLSLSGIVLNIVLVCAVGFFHWQIRSHVRLRKSKENIETRLKEFQFDIPSTLQPPTSAAGQPSIYPGRIWRLEWGDMEEPYSPGGSPRTPGSSGASGTTKITYSIIGPGVGKDRTNYTTDYKTYL